MPFSSTATSPVRNQPSRKAFARLVGLAPVLQEHRRARGPRSRRRRRRRPGACLIHQPHLDARQRRADAAGTSLAVQRVGQRHADLGHAVALQQDVPGDLAATLQDRHRQGRRAGHHEAQLAAALGPCRCCVGRSGLLPGVDQLGVDRGHGHEQRQVAVRRCAPRPRPASKRGRISQVAPDHRAHTR